MFLEKHIGRGDIFGGFVASGKKNYFRHHVNARTDSKIVQLINRHGKEAYFHYFALLEMCAQKAIADDLSGDDEFVFHRRTVCAELMVTQSRLGGHLLAIQSALLGEVVLTPQEVKIKFPNLRKYLGKYEIKNTPNSPNKRKEKEIKRNKIKGNEIKDSSPQIPTTGIREAYQAAYLKRYGINPVWAAKENSLAKKLLANVGLDEGIKLAEYYPTFSDRFHEMKKHPFSLLVSQIDQVRISMLGKSKIHSGNPYLRELEAMDLTIEVGNE